MSSERYTAESLEDIAKALESLAYREEFEARLGMWSKGSIKNHNGAARAYKDAADILRHTTIVPKPPPD